MPEAQGGLGLGLVDAVVVLEEMGRVAFPGPYLGSSVVATIAARRLGLTDLLADLGRGECVTVALEEPGTRRPRRTRADPRRAAGCPLDADRGEADRPRRPDGRLRARRRKDGRRPRHLPRRRSRRRAGPHHGSHPHRRPPPARRRERGARRTRWGPHRDLAGRRRRHGRGARGGARRRLRRVARDGDGLRRAPGAVRPADRAPPGDPAQARGHAPRNRAGPGRRALRRMGVRRRGPRRRTRPRPSPSRRWGRPR